MPQAPPPRPLPAAPPVPPLPSLKGTIVWVLLTLVVAVGGLIVFFERVA